MKEFSSKAAKFALGYKFGLIERVKVATLLYTVAIELALSCPEFIAACDKTTGSRPPEVRVLSDCYLKRGKTEQHTLNFEAGVKDIFIANVLSEKMTDLFSELYLSL